MKNPLKVITVLLAVLFLAACSQSMLTGDPWRCAADEECADSDPCSIDRCESSTGACRHYLGCIESISEEGGNHLCAVTTSGGLKCWGENSHGEIGIGSLAEWAVRYPADVVGLTSGIRAVSARGWNTCSIDDAGGVKCWGDNEYGWLGVGLDPSILPESPVPLDVLGLSSGVAAISLGGACVCVVMEISGGVKCWGENRHVHIDYLCGIDIYGNVYAPADVTGLDSGVAAVSAGAVHQCALMATGGIKCWGANYSRQLGVGPGNSDQCSYFGNTTPEYCISPVDVVGLESGVAAISAGSFHTCALMLSGAVKCWGENYYGQLGDGTLENRYTPVDVLELSSGVVEISTGGGNSYALMSSGEIRSWGINNCGQLGNGSFQGSVQGIPEPVDVLGLPDAAVAVAAGGTFACALLVTGEVACWGCNEYGQLGDGTREDRPTPAKVLAY
jgi:alpha-tubulin suppressor-like RCC1 family protein